MVSLELIASLHVLVRYLAAERPQDPVRPAVGVPGRVSEREPGGVPRALSALHSLRKPDKSFGISLKPAAFTMLLR